MFLVHMVNIIDFNINLIYFFLPKFKDVLQAEYYGDTESYSKILEIC